MGLKIIKASEKSETTIRITDIFPGRVVVERD